MATGALRDFEVFSSDLRRFFQLDDGHLPPPFVKSNDQSEWTPPIRARITRCLGTTRRRRPPSESAQPTLDAGDAPHANEGTSPLPDASPHGRAVLEFSGAILASTSERTEVVIGGRRNGTPALGVSWRFRRWESGRRDDPPHPYDRRLSGLQFPIR